MIIYSRPSECVLSTEDYSTLQMHEDYFHSSNARDIIARIQNALITMLTRYDVSANML